MEPFTTLTSRYVALPVRDVDTDQIIPARFLRTTSREGLGTALFADWRYDASGAPRPEFVLNRAEAAGAEILVAGENFGCGSSREHAPWALRGFGFRAVLAPSFGDIFRTNALKNGLLPVALAAELIQRLLGAFERGEARPITIEIESQTVTLGDGTRASFPIDPFAKHCLLEGVDELGFLLGQAGAIDAYERAHPAPVHTR